MVRIAIVIVTYNSAAEIGGCLDSLRELSDVEVVVVDNASRDSTREEVKGRGRCVIANPTNVGFATAVNQGVRATTAPLILLLNPDAHLVSGIDALAARLEMSQSGGRWRHAHREGWSAAEAVSWQEICLRQRP